MDQFQALQILTAGRSAVISGPPGSGKTHLLKQFIDLVQAKKKLALTASTGLAATHIGGMTIHSWSGIGIQDQYQDRIVDDIIRRIRPARRDQIEACQVLIIDEISMLTGPQLDLIEAVCRRIRQSGTILGQGQPFGGLQVIMSGDFLQLAPVGSEDLAQIPFVTTSVAWQQLEPTVCYLNQQQRRSEADPLENLLISLRQGHLSPDQIELLKSRQRPVPAQMVIPELYCKNVSVDYFNDQRLARLPGPLVESRAQLSGSQTHQQQLKKACQAPELLQLKVGAAVMFVKNHQYGHYVNGTLGTVTGFSDLQKVQPTVMVRLDNPSGQILKVSPESWQIKTDPGPGSQLLAAYQQLPLRLAWALTVHKSQGLTLSQAKIDLTDAFAPGLGYVALSRLAGFEGLYLTGFNQTALVLSDQARRIDQRLIELSGHRWTGAG